jgi:protein TonB
MTPLSVEFVDRPPRPTNVRDLGPRMRELYPPTYRQVGIEGQAVVEFVVDAQGRVEDEGMSIVSSTHPDFRQATQELIKLLRFEPATVNGRPVRVWIRMPVEWKIS